MTQSADRRPRHRRALDLRDLGAGHSRRIRRSRLRSSRRSSSRAFAREAVMSAADVLSNASATLRLPSGPAGQRATTPRCWRLGPQRCSANIPTLAEVKPNPAGRSLACKEAVNHELEGAARMPQGIVWITPAVRTKIMNRGELRMRSQTSPRTVAHAPQAWRV
jgi:hypothetical protein